MIVKKDPAVIQNYFEDSSNLKNGRAEAVFIPEGINDISFFLKEADREKTPVTVSGAGTGTSGGRVPFGGAVLSLERMNKIKSISRTRSGGSVIAEAGVLISDLKDAADKEGLFYTYDPTEQAAFVGGTLATNASGARSFKYGPTRKFTKAMRLVLADGTVLDLKRGDYAARGGAFDLDLGKKRIKFNIPEYKMPEVKNAAGYYAKKGMDLVDLFIGQEGTLAVIAECELELASKPQDILSCLAFFSDEEKAISFCREAKETGALAIEYFDDNSLGLLRAGDRRIPPNANCAIFFEEDLADKKDEERALNKWQGLLLKYSLSPDDVWAAMTEKERKEFQYLRHAVPEMINEKVRRNKMPKLSTDLAVPDNKFMEMFYFYKECAKNCGMDYLLFGHIGDSHLHFNILPTTEELYEEGKKICTALVRKSVSLGGTVSAEHGIGKMRRDYLKMLYGESGMREMAAVKKTWDPNGILGRGNIIPEEML